ncbi:MAG: glycosyltransferase [Pyrinomonadaceae bacterium MAG19_C2-C3]|nr:glycosyltransferase [Pyrinomonadaceae bacterium MAG19_C2-C3]
MNVEPNSRQVDPRIDIGANVHHAPTVSIVIPCYNVAPFVAETLRSVFAQTYSDYEAIIVNDGSPDTAEFEQAIAPYQDRIVYIKQQNAGPSGARNAGIMNARGTYIALLDADDLWLPEFLNEQVKLITSDEALRLVYADTHVFGEGINNRTRAMDTTPSNGEATFESLIEMTCTVLTSSVVAHRQTMIDAGLFDTKFKHAEDYDLYLRIAHKGFKITYSRQPRVRHRIHAASLSASVTAMLQGQINVYCKLEATLELDEKQRAIIKRQIENRTAQLRLEQGKSFFIAGEYDKARASLQEAARFINSRKMRAVRLSLRVAPQLVRQFYLWRTSVAKAEK